MEKEIRFYYDLKDYDELLNRFKNIKELEYKGCFFEKTTQYDNPKVEYSFYSKEIDGRFRYRISKDIEKEECKAKISWKRRLNDIKNGIHTEEEIEVNIPPNQIDQMEFLIENVIKMPKIECYERYRNVFDGGNVEIVIDKFPFIVALEIESKDGLSSSIEEWLKKLNLNAKDSYALSWDDKYKEICITNRSYSKKICYILMIDINIIYRWCNMGINNKNIDLNLYRTFYNVAETGSISKTAEKLFITQPSVSYSIRSLENELNVKLFNRTAKGVELTPEGKTLRFYVENAFNSINIGEKCLVGNLNEIVDGELSIGVPSHVGVFFLSKYILNFHRRFPNIKIHISSRSTSKLVELLELHRLDLIVDATPIIGKNKNLIVKHLKNFDCCFAVHKNNNAYERKKKLSIEELSKLPLILPGKSNNNRIGIDNYFAKANTKASPIIEVSTTDMMIDFVKRDMGVGYFIKDSIQEQLEKGIFDEVLLQEALPTQEVGVAYLGDYMTNILKKFIELFNEYGIVI